MMWIVILLVTLIFMGGMAVYLVSRFTKFQIVKRLSKGKKKKAWLFSTFIFVFLSAILIYAIDFMNYIVIMIHLGIIWMIIDTIIWIVKKFTRDEIKLESAIKQKPDTKIESDTKLESNSKLEPQNRDCYLAGILAVFVTITYLALGWYQAHHVWEKDYVVETVKNPGDLRIVLFADAHLGTTFNGVEFEKHVVSMQSCNPDIVVISGDFVDDGTTKEDMIAGCKALSKFDVPCGVYYVFGNHDKGYYGNEYRGFGRDELVENLETNGVVVLEDDSILIDNRFYLFGRQDRSEEQRGARRATMDELTANLDAEKFMVVLDHQPNDYDAQVTSGVDLVLSGHTHGGQLIPITYVGEWIGANDKTYGIEKRQDTTFIVTSGISDWAIKFKTGCRSEYVVIDIAEK